MSLSTGKQLHVSGNNGFLYKSISECESFLILILVILVKKLYLSLYHSLIPNEVFLKTKHILIIMALLKEKKLLRYITGQIKHLVLKQQETKDLGSKMVNLP